MARYFPSFLPGEPTFHKKRLGVLKSVTIDGSIESCNVCLEEPLAEKRLLKKLNCSVSLVFDAMYFILKIASFRLLKSPSL